MQAQASPHPAPSPNPEAGRDPLTGLPGRDGLQEALERSAGGSVALTILDLDRFRRVNLGGGVEAGDALLVRVAEALGQVVRRDDVVARTGPDQFSLLCRVVSAPQAVRIAERARSAIADLDRTDPVTASAGVAFHPEGGDADLVIEQAEKALHSAREAGGDRLVLHRDTLSEIQHRELRLARELPAAIAGDQLVLEFHPIVDLATERPVAYEARLGWDHPELGPLAPGEFVPIAERTGAMADLGRWALDQACRAFAASVTDERVGLWIGLSARQLEHRDLVEAVAAALQRAGVSPGRLTLLISETALAPDGVSVAALTRLKQLGLRVAIGDFGTGYATLAHLRRVPADVLRLDPALTAGVGRDVRDAAIVRAVVALGRDLGLEVVADGVESASQAGLLRSIGCHRALGARWGGPVADLPTASQPADDDRVGPPAEERRLAALREYDVLDSPPEPGFDALIRLACAHFDAPIALVSLVDEQRLWFKARIGLTEAVEAPADGSFCRVAIERPDEVLVVPDATLDPRFSLSPVVTGDRGIRFYAGAPIVGSAGVALGTICVLDRRARVPDEAALQALRDLAGLAAELLEARRRHRQVATLVRRSEVVEQQARDSERWVATIHRPADLVVVTDRQAVIRYAGPASTTLLGAGSDELADRAALDLVHPADRDRVARILGDVLTVPGAHPSVEARLVRPDGTWTWTEVSAENLLDDDAIAGMVISIRDISERVRTQQFITQILDTFPHGVFWKDRSGTIRGCNRTFARALGFDQPYLAVGCDGTSLLTPDQVALTNRLDERILTGAASRLDDELTAELAGAGVRRLHRTRVPLLEDGEITGVLCVVADVTSIRHLEQQVEGTRHLEAIGHLAAGIAHEINTPMQYIGDNVAFLGKVVDRLLALVDTAAGELPAGTDDQPSPFHAAAATARLDYLRVRAPKAVEQAADGVRTVARIVAAMKDFSHPGVEEKTPTDLRAAIDNTLTVCRNEWKYVAHTEVEVDDDVPLVPLYPGEFNQVLLNLVVNAAHAIADRFGADAGPDAGLIRFQVSSTTDDRVRIVVSDNGCGIPDAVRGHIFDPFFTTKQIGKGTGQGLAMARQVVVKRHDGTITASSQPGQGSAFTVVVPGPVSA